MLVDRVSCWHSSRPRKILVLLQIDSTLRVLHSFTVSEISLSVESPLPTSRVQGLTTTTTTMQTSNNAIISTTISRRSRQLLIFNHNAKAGGGSIKEILDAFKECRVRDKYWKTKTARWDRNTNCYIEVTDGHGTRVKERKRGFVIGNVREPCSQYLSLWSYGSAGHGGFVRNKKNELLADFYGTDDPFFNTTRDVLKFQAWLQHPNVAGIISERFNRSYGTELDGVDCWVFIDRFQESLVDCLRLYEAQGGYGNWSAPKVVELVRIANEKQNAGSNRQRELGNSSGKNDPLGNPQTKHHSPCAHYFTPELSKWMLESSEEQFIYKTFGYQGCCSQERIETIIPNAFILQGNYSSSSSSSSLPLLLEESPSGLLSVRVSWFPLVTAAVFGLLVSVVVYMFQKRRPRQEQTISSLSTTNTTKEYECIPLTTTHSF